MYVSGTIDTKVIKGARGDFVVGMLTCSSFSGVFETKSPLLDQFPPGIYRGQFDITEIYIDHYKARQGQFISKLCARIADAQIDIEEEEIATIEGSAANAGPVIDPLVAAGVVRDHMDESPASELPAHALASAGPSVAHEPVIQVPEVPAVPIPALQAEPALGQPDAGEEVSQHSAGDLDIDLFGDLADDVRARKPISLDPADGKFRPQTYRLKELGYGYKPTLKQWLVKA